LAIQQKSTKIRGVADIVFCIDFSGSMSPCIEGVKNHINTFVKSLETASPNTIIDWRIAFCAYSDDTFIIKDFVTETNSFVNSLAGIDTMGNEFTPGAIDYCLTKFNWRPVSNKFLVVFTDEELEGGWSTDNGDGSSKYQLLLDKIGNSGSRLFFFGPKCPYYEQIEKVSRTFVSYLKYGDFSSVDFSALFTTLGKTVSQSCSQHGGESKSDKNFVYNLSSFKNISV